MAKVRWLLGIALLVSACQTAPAMSAGVPTSPAALGAAATEAAGPPELATEAPASPGTPLPSFEPPGTTPFGITPLATWAAPAEAAVSVSIPVDLERLSNRPVIDGLTPDQQAFLAQNGFAVLHTQDAQFSDIREKVSLKHGQPYYLTTDAAFHALHLTFDEMLKALEREQLNPRLRALLDAMLTQVWMARDELSGTAVEADARQAEAYLSVARRLLDPSAYVDPELEPVVSQQVDQIMAAAGRAKSVLFPDFEDDYGAYKPVGHYAGDPALEAYFRAMTWFGRVHFPLADPTNADFRPSRLPLILTLALRRASLDGENGARAWATIHEVLTFLIGPSDDAGPIEYAGLMDRVYGDRPTYPDLVDEARWSQFQALKDELPAPRINSTFLAQSSDLKTNAGWRFLGQRFTLDAYVFQNLVFDQVKEQDGRLRLLPSARDVMAVFGSEAALASLTSTGDTAFPNYSEQMEKLRQAVRGEPQDEWLARFYDAWLYAFLPVLAPKGEPFPPVMRTVAWSYKDMNAALGSWAELKHDTILYTKMPEGMGGGGPPSSGPAPAYVEANPEAFYRLAFMASNVADGLAVRGMSESVNASRGGDGQGFATVLSDLVSDMGQLGERFRKLGDIAAREIAGEELGPDDFEIIQACLGISECQVVRQRSYGMTAEMKPAPIVAAVAGGGSQSDRVLEVATGNIDRIYVVVPLEGKLQVAQGGVYSFYEFTQPRAERLTDDEWRQRLASEDPPLPIWAGNFLLRGGEPTPWLAFRRGDVYLVNDAGADLNLRAQPGSASEVLARLEAGDYLEFIDGPIQAGGRNWWKANAWTIKGELTGWVVESQEWYDRAYGQ